MRATSNIDDLVKRLIPLTYLRRNAGEVLSKLKEVGELVLTKGGKPVAKLTSLAENRGDVRDVETDLEKLRTLVGGFSLGGNLTPKKLNKLLDKRYDEMLPR